MADSYRSGSRSRRTTVLNPLPDLPASTQFDNRVPQSNSVLVSEPSGSGSSSNQGQAYENPSGKMNIPFDGMNITLWIPEKFRGLLPTFGSVESECLECSVCLEEIDEDERLSCRHPLCTECLGQMTMDKCPVCRGHLEGPHVTPEVLSKIYSKTKREDPSENWNLIQSQNLGIRVEEVQGIYDRFSQYGPVPNLDFGLIARLRAGNVINWQNEYFRLRNVSLFDPNFDMNFNFW